MQADKLNRVIQGDASQSDVVDTQWVPVKIYGPQSVESEIKFRELTSSDQEQIGSGIKLKDGKSYGEVLAPVY